MAKVPTGRNILSDVRSASHEGRQKAEYSIYGVHNKFA